MGLSMTTVFGYLSGYFFENFEDGQHNYMHADKQYVAGL